MADEKHTYQIREEPPIPSYEEATSSSSPYSSRLGPQEASDDAERQTLLGHDLSGSSGTQSNSRRRNGYYHPPSVQSVDDEDDDDSGLGSPVDADEEAALRETMEEMDILDPEAAEDGRARRNRSRGRFSKRFYSITNSLSSFHLPRIKWPSSPNHLFTWIKARMPTIPEEYRPGWAVIARLCGLILIVVLVYLLVVSEVVPMGGGGFGAPFNPEWVRQFALQNVEGYRIQNNLQYVTSYDHVGGTEGSYVLGRYIEEKFMEAHMDTYTHDEYFVYLNYPKAGGRRVAIVEPKEKAWEARLEEEDAYDPPRAQTQTFHGYSASGNVTGPLIYVNYGHKKDFKTLWDSGIDVQGAVVLMRYYGSQPDRAMKVKAAQDAGVAGVIMYSDPAEDGFKKGKVWPDGQWRPLDSVQRGSVAFSNMIIGDVLTPGQPSTKDQKRTSKNKNPALPTIPSIPVSWSDAQKLLQSLNGIGEKISTDGNFEHWIGGVPDVGESWWSGHPEKSPKVNLQNEQEEVDKQRITNVFGSFLGSEDKAKKIIIGNHRDSWCFGAADPGSGTAVMLEVARVLGELRMQGWRPLRTIEFASWDAEEYNMIGSTEHVEANVEELRVNAIAYLNVGAGVTGDKLWANGSPIFKHALNRVLDRMSDPHQNVTLLELWKKDHGGELGGLGVDGDYAAFQAIAGCSSLDFGFSGPEHGDMAHSCYETFEWMSKYIDPGFVYHTLLTQMWLLIILELAQESIMPLKVENYATRLQEEGQKLIEWTETKASDYDIGMFQPLVDALANVGGKAQEFAQWEATWYNQVYGTGGFETQGLIVQRVAHNAKIAGFESDLLDLQRGNINGEEEHGLPGRTQFKHVVFGPSAFDASERNYVFPFIRDAIEQKALGKTKDWKLAEKQIKKTADILNNAAERLIH
ncbi:Zn-dependent exopeptidase [Bimuria novae-zelandiae CBS 107.79]|uniref:Zn-dependent exopeptidase n=1 Tax=Bimuria novae-zelandiae CBS 107.79 TaxID=1447943 RepID=A0A6A5VLL9_9PLEO|nr:Zn-dependent exopeptidase [Bimuria novae-zelandiae CBS 107.79]